MDKEKENEELAEFIGETISVRHEGDRFPLTVLTRDFLARRIINEGYRKADEVRKETAREILQVLFENHFEKVNDYENRRVGYSVHDFYCQIKRLAEKYGVEVDE